MRECLKVAQECGIDSKDELIDALWFLHTKMGVIRYFPDGDLSDIVIIHPELLFNMITELFIKTFKFEIDRPMSEEFKKRGIFSFDAYKKFNTTHDTLLTPSLFIELLKQLRVVVPFHDKKAGKEKLLIPCVWKHADESCNPPRQHSSVPTLAITFDCGYCPKGVAGATVKYLMTNEMNSKLDWELLADQIFRDQVAFSVGPHIITLSLYATHFEVVFAPSTSNAEAVCSIRDTCREICRSIQKGIETVSRDANLACCCEPSFYCTLCNLKSHIAKLVRHEGVPCHLLCSEKPQPAVCEFPNGFHYWIDGPPLKQSKATDQSTVTLTLHSACEVVFSIRSQWKSLGLFLEVDEGTLDAIELDNKKADDCLREMLKAWLRKCDPRPSWPMLAEASDLLDQTVSEKIRDMYCTL